SAYSLTDVGQGLNSRGQRSRAFTVVTGGVVLLMLALIGAGTVVAWRDGKLNAIICGGECGPDNAIAPTGVRSAATGDFAVDSQLRSPELEAVLDRTRGPMGATLLGDHVAI